MPPFWEELADEEAAREAEKAAAARRQAGGMGAMLLPYVEDEGPFATAGAVISPREKSFADAANQREPSKASQYLDLLGSNLATAAEKTGLKKVGEEALGALGDIGETAGTLYRYPARVAGNLMAGEAPFKREEFSGALHDLKAVPQRLAHWATGGFVGAPKAGEGLSGQTVRESVEALSGPFEDVDGKVRLKPGVTPWQAARMVGGGLAGLGSEVLSFPGGIAPGVANPAEFLASKAAPKIGRGLERGAEALLGDPGPAKSALLNPRRGVLNIGEGPHRPEDEALKRIYDTAHEIVDPKGWEKVDVFEVGPNKQQAIEAMVEPALASNEEVARYAGLSDAELRQALKDNLRLGKQSERQWSAAASLDKPLPSGTGTLGSLQVDPKANSAAALLGEAPETLGLSEAATSEIIGTGAEAAKAPQIRAQRGATEEEMAMRLERIKGQFQRLVEQGGDDAQFVKDFNHNLTAPEAVRFARSVGGSVPDRTKPSALAEVRRILAQNATSEEVIPTTPQALAAANDMDVVKQDETALNQARTQAPPPGPGADITVHEPSSAGFTKQLDREMLFGQQGRSPDFAAGGLPPGWSDISKDMPAGYVERGYRWVRNPQGQEFLVDPSGEMSLGRQLPFVEPPPTGQAPGGVPVPAEVAPPPPPTAPGGGGPLLPQRWQAPPPAKRPPLEGRWEPGDPGPPPSGGSTINITRAPRPASGFSREGSSQRGLLGGIANTVRDDIAMYASKPNSQAVNETLNRMTDIEHTARDRMRMMPKLEELERRIDKSGGLRHDPPAVAELKEHVPDAYEPDFVVYKATAHLDDAAKKAVGDNLRDWENADAQAWAEEGYRPAFQETGEAAQDAGVLRLHGQGPTQQVRPFQHNPDKTEVAHRNNFELDWMGENGHPVFERYLDKLLAHPLNEGRSASREEIVSHLSEIRKNPDRQAAYEFDRLVPYQPDLFFDAPTNKWYVVNRSLYDLIPSNRNPHGGLMKWYEGQHLRAAAVENWGTPQLDRPGLGLNYIGEPGGLKQRVLAESGTQAWSEIEKGIAGLMGNRDMAGWTSATPLGPTGGWGRAVKEGLNAAAQYSVKWSGAKSVIQALQETPKLAPGLFSGLWRTLTGAGKYGKGYLSDLLRAIGQEKAADWLAKAPRQVAAEVGVALADLKDATAHGFTRAWDETAELQTLYPGVEQAVARGAEATAKAGSIAMTPFKFANKLVAARNDAVAGELGADIARDWIKAAKSGPISRSDLLALDRLGVRPQSLDMLKAIGEGRAQATPEFAERLAREFQRVTPWETQFRNTSPLRTQKIINDSVASKVLYFLRYQMNTLRHTEEFGKDLLNAKSAGEAWRAVQKLSVRLVGSQLNGEAQRLFYQQVLGKEDTDLERNSVAGRMAMNLLYANLLGPVFWLTDFGLQSAGVERPWAKRGRKTERAFGPTDMIYPATQFERGIKAAAGVFKDDNPRGRRKGGGFFDDAGGSSKGFFDEGLRRKAGFFDEGHNRRKGFFD